jgi:hypothetical protein
MINKIVYQDGNVSLGNIGCRLADVAPETCRAKNEEK